jgi:hypothetical protein
MVEDAAKPVISNIAMSEMHVPRTAELQSAILRSSQSVYIAAGQTRGLAPLPLRHE